MVAQSIDYEKQKQVISEIVLKAFNQDFMDKLYENCDNGVGSSLSLLGLKGGPASSESMNESLSMNNKHKMLCGLFQDFAHASCMRLNGASMEKLYDLMVMCFKYQLFHTRSAEEVHAITLNHLDSLERMVSNPKTFFENKPGCVENFTKVQVPRKSSESENLQNNSSLLIRSTKQNFINYYSKYNNIEYDFIRNCLNKLFEKSLTRISMFLRSNVQDEKGKFIYSKTFDNKLSEKFNLLNRNVVDVCFRGSKLGYSLYHIFGRGVVESSEDHHHHDQRQDTNREIKSNNLNSHSSNNTSRTSHRSSIAIDEILAISQLQILENTIGSQKNEEEFTPDLFDDEIDSAGLL